MGTEIERHGVVKMIILDGININNHNMYLVEDRPPVPTAQQDTEQFVIRGRNGSLTKKYAYLDILYPLNLAIYDNVSFKPAFRKGKQVLFSAKKLAFEDEPEIFYKIKSVQIDIAENDVAEFGQFIANFVLAPFAYVQTDLITITQQTTLFNSGYESEPYIKAYVAGTGKIYIGNQIITITGVNGTIEIDSEMMNAYRNENGLITNLNNKMIGDFPILKSGNNVIKFDGDITKLEINPRWRWI